MSDAVGKSSFSKRLLSHLIVILLGLLVGHLLTSNVVYHVKVSGSSMEPTYYDGDSLWVLVNSKVTYGSIVVAKNPEDNEYIIKRVIALPGDTIQVKDGKVYLNGSVIQESYISCEWLSGGVAEEEILLNNNEYFIMGDNRSVSRDSRMFGPVTKDNIKGVVWFKSIRKVVF